MDNDIKLKSKLKVIEAKLSNMNGTNIVKQGQLGKAKIRRIRYKLEDLKRDVRNEKMVLQGMKNYQATKHMQNTSFTKNSNKIKRGK